MGEAGAVGRYLAAGRRVPGPLGPCHPGASTQPRAEHLPLSALRPRGSADPPRPQPGPRFGGSPTRGADGLSRGRRVGRTRPSTYEGTPTAWPALRGSRRADAPGRGSDRGHPYPMTHETLQRAPTGRQALRRRGCPARQVEGADQPVGRIPATVDTDGALTSCHSSLVTSARFTAFHTTTITRSNRRGSR
jgi:hypothetical protein